MWAKFIIETYKIPFMYNTGFVIDSKNNNIINTDKNYKIKIKFNLNSCNEVYYYELLSSNNILKLILIININLIKNFIQINDVVPYKNNLFKILKKTYKNNLKVHSFKKYNNILNIINNKYSNTSYSKIIEIKNLHFDLISEQILYDRQSYIKLINNNCNIFFLFGKYLNFNISDHKLCIIDDNYKLIDKITINKTNYGNINKDFFKNNKLVNIDKDFFYSKEYIKPYKLFHSKYTTKHAFDNYKKYIENKSSNYPVYNIELFKDYIIIIKDIDISDLINHPLLHSTNYIFVINDKITIKSIENSEKIIKTINKSIVNYKLNLENHLYLDSNKYLLYSMYRDRDTIRRYEYNIPNIDIKLNIFDERLERECAINQCTINYSTYIKLNCKCSNFFYYNNLWIYLIKKNICPYCRNIVNNIDVFVYREALLVNLFGDIFSKYYSNKYNYIYLSNTANTISKFLDKIDNTQTYTILNITEEDIPKDSYLLVEDDVNLFNLLNSFNNIDIRNIKKIIKFSRSI